MPVGARRKVRLPGMTPDGQRDPAAEARPRRRGWLTAAAVAVVVALVTAVGARWVIEEFRTPTCEFTAGDSTERRTPEQAANAATIAMVSLDRDLPPKAATIALATAVQESKLRNLTYGDADSLGLFQQRPSQGWGSEEEILDPVYAANTFFAAMERIPDWAGWVVTEIAQEVQRSAYPEAYADHEHEGRTIASALTGHSPTGLACRLDEPTDRGRPDTFAAAVAEQTGQDASADGQVVSVRASDDRHAWAVGAWAVAQAKARNVRTVQVGDRVWTRDRGDAAMSWDDADEPVPGPQVRVTLHGG